MTAVLAKETRISFATLADEQGVTLATVARWATQGARGHRLESFYCGSRRFTSREAYERWLGRINGELAGVELVAQGA